MNQKKHSCFLMNMKCINPFHNSNRGNQCKIYHFSFDFVQPKLNFEKSYEIIEDISTP